MKKLIALLFSIMISLYGFSQTNCKCCTSNHNAFDFWIGDWVVYDTLNNIVGENIIVEMQDGCTLQENWKSKSSTGTSYNYYNAADSSWNQVWIDNQGGSLVLKGNVANGIMVMRSELQQGKNVKEYYNQISWSPNADGTVTQTWNIYDRNSNYLSTLFKGIYKKR